MARPSQPALATAAPRQPRVTAAARRRRTWLWWSVDLYKSDYPSRAPSGTRIAAAMPPTFRWARSAVDEAMAPALRDRIRHLPRWGGADDVTGSLSSHARAQVDSRQCLL